MISVCIPVYNGALTLAETIKSILGQTLADFEMVIVDNASTDNTQEVVKSFFDPRIKLYRNEKNLGCGGNLDACRKNAKGDILFYICADDIASPNALAKVNEAFSMDENIGVVARPYYWFQEDVHKPVRATRQFNKTDIVDLSGGFDKVAYVLALSDQISGMAYRKKYMNASFGSDCFVEASTMTASMLKVSKAVILKENIIAVRISDNGAMKPYAYRKSPMMCWYDMVVSVFSEDRYKQIKNFLIRDFIAKNFIGLVQIKNFAGTRALLREIMLLLKFRWQNVLSPVFWFFSIGTLVVPGSLLWKMVVFFKNNVNSKVLKNTTLGG